MGVRVRTPVIAIIACVFLVSIQAAAAQEGPIIQAFFGSLKLDDQTAEWDEVSDTEIDVDFSSLPSGGIEAEYTYGGEQLRWGINSGGSIAWKNDGTRISGGFSGDTGGVIRVELDNSLFLLELHLGGFVRSKLSETISFYVAAGPMVMYGKHEVEDDDLEETLPSSRGSIELESSDDSDFAVGAYARTGLDFEFRPGQQVGLGIRYMKTELDFDKTFGKLDIEGPQYVITYTAAL